MQLTNRVIKKENEHWWYDLPFGFTHVDTHFGERPLGFRFSRSILTIEAQLHGKDIVVCGEAANPDLAMKKAIAELVERASLIEWTRKNPRAKIFTSNGWAAHDLFGDARVASVCELVERDAVLAQWYTATPFLEIESASLPKKILNWENSELFQSELPNLRVLISTRGLGPSVTAIFMNEGGFGVSAHATKPTLAESLDSAIAEACRAAHHFVRRAFWQETHDLLKGVDSKRIDPATHALCYAYHLPFPKWMFGSTIPWTLAEDIWSKERSLDEFEFTQTLSDPLIVGFATNDQCFQLSWGRTDANQIVNSKAGRRLALTMSNINQQPHIVS